MNFTILNLLLLVLLIGACGQVMEQNAIPSNWVGIRVNEKFSFRLPPGFVEQPVRGIDSYVRKWETGDMVVQIDYGKFSDPLNLYSKKNEFEEKLANLDNQNAKIITFRQDNGWLFSAIHFSNFEKATSRNVIKLTMTIESSPDVDQEIPLKILKSIYHHTTLQ